MKPTTKTCTGMVLLLAVMLAACTPATEEKSDKRPTQGGQWEGLRHR